MKIDFEKVVALVLLGTVAIGILISLLNRQIQDDESVRSLSYIQTYTITTSGYIGTASVSTTTTL